MLFGKYCSETVSLLLNTMEVFSMIEKSYDSWPTESSITSVGQIMLKEILGPCDSCFADWPTDVGSIDSIKTRLQRDPILYVSKGPT